MNRARARFLGSPIIKRAPCAQINDLSCPTRGCSRPHGSSPPNPTPYLRAPFRICHSVPDNQESRLLSRRSLCSTIVPRMYLLISINALYFLNELTKSNNTAITCICTQNCVTELISVILYHLRNFGGSFLYVVLEGYLLIFHLHHSVQLKEGHSGI